MPSRKKIQNSFRTGIGYDLHRLVKGRPCILGGVKLPFAKGPLGHSDGDALLHAICDALLGAAGLDDLGSLFPDTDSKFINASSGSFLQEAVRRLHQAGFRIVNVDAVVIAQAPRIGPHRDKIRSSIAKQLHIPKSSVNVKGKSGEGIGPIGNQKAIAVIATAMLAVGTR